ncbi:MAG: cyclic nucleotide-binding domain-containing protein [Myxococcales bacterium]|nr:cyclic nucleotide-binding domain-containing protein [Myxococcales bacterium]
MSLTNEHLRSIPLLASFSDEQLERFKTVFERLELTKGEKLFAAGDKARALYLVASGEVTLSEGDAVDIHVRPPAPIGELGALSDIERNTTARVSEDAVVWRAPRDKLSEFLAANTDIAFVFYDNLTHVVADKIHRDERRLEDMRKNLIRTQKAMKKLRDYVAESEDTPISEHVHDTLDYLIRNNRRANYRVEPPSSLAALVRLDDNSELPVVEISRTHFSLEKDSGALPDTGDRVSGVLKLAGPELPVSGRVLRTLDRRVDVELDLLIDEYIAVLEGYLSRVQMVDFVV